MPVLSESERQSSMPANQCFVSAISACNIQPSETELAVPTPPSGVATAAVVTVNPLNQDAIATLT